MIRRILAGSRYFIVIAVLGSFLASVSALVYGGIVVVKVTLDAFLRTSIDETGVKDISIAFIETIDLFLLGTILYIIALGLYTLFIDDSLPVPNWLHIRDLDNLKEKLLSTIIVLLSVTFLGYVMSWDKSDNILAVGLGVGAVLAALALLVGSGKFGGIYKSREKENEKE